MTERYVPAAGRRGLTAIYDPVMALTMREGTWRARLADRVLDGLRTGATVVDVGAGTGTFAALLAQRRSDVNVVAIDGDPDVLDRAAAKGVHGRRGLADALPLATDTVDRVTMSLLLHHLTTDTKRAALAEARRVLKPSGRLHIADWGRAHDPLMRAAFLGLQLLDGFAPTRDHAAGRIPHLVAATGFAAVAEDARYRTPFGSLELITAS